MKIAAFSDCHGDLPQIEKVDVLIIAGDICPEDNHDPIIQEVWIKDTFIPWLNNQPVKRTFIVPGNHDFVFDGRTYQQIRAMVEGPTNYRARVLIDEIIKIEDEHGHIISFYATPWCHQFGSWAFMRPDYTLSNLFYKIPEGIDFLICHDAPDINDHGKITQGVYAGKCAGNIPLADAIRAKKPANVIHGHIHSGNKYSTYKETAIWNVSIKDEDYKVVNPVTYIDYCFNTNLPELEVYKNPQQVDEVLSQLIAKYASDTEYDWHNSGRPEDHEAHLWNILKTLYEQGGAQKNF